jgi:NADH-quinone oxidoreductase subunit M
MTAYLVPLLLALPVLGAIVVACFDRGSGRIAWDVGIGVGVANFILSLALLFLPIGSGDFVAVFDREWIAVLGTHFKVGVDGISIWLILLTTFLTPLVLLSAHHAIEHRVREFVACILILETGMLGAFVALDLFLFYVFWEVMLISMYLLIGIWGGTGRLYASIKFVLYTMIGSLLMLAAIFYVYVKNGMATGIYTTDLALLESMILSPQAQLFCFLAFALAFAIKVPLFPFHTWLPDAHTEAPTAGSVILAGVLLKFGVYGFIRFGIPLFPEGAMAAAPYLVALAVAGIVYGALVAFVQADVKKLVAYSSVSHLGFCIMGLFAMNGPGITGSIYAMISHGLTTGGLFLAIGILYERRHTRLMAEFGGLRAQMPVFAAMFLICVLGSAGLPGLSGFVGEFLTILGLFNATNLPEPMITAAIAATGVILGAVYLLYMFQKVMFGPLDNPKNKDLPDLNRRELAVFLPLVILIFVMGIYPKPFLRIIEPSVEKFIQKVETKLARSKGALVEDHFEVPQ